MFRGADHSTLDARTRNLKPQAQKRSINSACSFRQGIEVCFVGATHGQEVESQELVIPVSLPHHPVIVTIRDNKDYVRLLPSIPLLLGGGPPKQYLSRNTHSPK